VIWLTLIWLLVGFAGGIHAKILGHRQLVKDYPRMFSKSDNPFTIDYIGTVILMLIAVIGGPCTLLTNLLMFGKECFK